MLIFSAQYIVAKKVSVLHLPMIIALANLRRCCWVIRIHSAMNLICCDYKDTAFIRITFRFLLKSYENTEIFSLKSYDNNKCYSKYGCAKSFLCLSLKS